MGNRYAELRRDQLFEQSRKAVRTGAFERVDKQATQMANSPQPEPVSAVRKNELYRKFKELKEFDRDCSATQSGMQLARDDAVTKETNYRRGGFGDRVRVEIKKIARILDPADPTLRTTDRHRRP